MTKENTKLTITLTNRAPVTIVKLNWLIIASASESPGSFVNGTPVPDSQCDTHRLIVRQHNDGRTIVYAILNAATAWTGTESRREGELLTISGVDAEHVGDLPAIVAAIRRVGSECGLLPCVVRDCIADLPAEKL